MGLTSPVLWFSESYPSISTFSFVNNCHYLIIVPIDFRFLLDLIGCRLTVEIKPIIIAPTNILFLAVAVTWLLRASGDMRRVPYKRSSPMAGFSASVCIVAVDMCVLLKITIFVEGQY